MNSFIMKKLYKELKKINALQDTMASLSDGALKGKTREFKKRLGKGETLDSLLPEAFAAVREADKRVLGKFPYDVQVLGGIALHMGLMAEMNTGEGKTLTATMPLYLNALTGESTILLTANDYLVERDAEEMGQVYNFMGMSCLPRLGTDDEADKKRIYSADIVYTTHGILGFDYLFNNLVKRAEDRFLRPFNYVIIDEADSVLLDSAQTPLVIAGSPRVQSNLYSLADMFVTTLEEGRDYETEEKRVWLNENGVRYAEKFFRIDNFYSEEHFEINRHVNLALKAHVLYEPGKDYMLDKEGELQLIDGGSGRMMPGVKMRGGQHQALEVREGLEASQETRSVASITYQNLFRLFPKMAGMSGTISDAAEELYNVYREKTVIIPPNKNLMRKDYKDQFFDRIEDQVAAAIEKALECHAKGQPVLFVVSTISDTEIVSKILVEEGVAHNVLNANNVYWEAQIIAEAGQLGAVTVATSMAGRGTDIKLGEGVAELGGLAVIGLGRMANTRQERQARGRSGRQGDPGFSMFFVCLMDEVVKQNSSESVKKQIDAGKRFSRSKARSLINQAQRLSEEMAVQSRKQATDYDTVMCMQREVIYGMRDKLLDGADFDKRKAIINAKREIARFLDDDYDETEECLNRYILDNVNYRLNKMGERLDYEDETAVRKYILGMVESSLKRQQIRIAGEEKYQHFLRLCTLKAIDDAWVEEVDYIQQLQAAVSGRATAQLNPVYEYEKEALESFIKMKKDIIHASMRNMLLSDVRVTENDELYIIYP